MPSPTAITAEQWRTYEEAGVMRLPGAIPAEAVTEMADRLWTFLAQRHGHHRNRPETWTAEWPAHFQPLERSGAFNAMATPLVRQAIDHLLGEGRWSEPDYWGHPLVTSPIVRSGGWRVPHQHWHIDYVPSAPPVARIFTFLDEVRPEGDGTVYLRGSHRLLAAMAQGGPLTLRSAEVRERLRRHPWFAELWSRTAAPDRTQRLMQEGAVIDGVPVAVTEMSGAPGDVLVMQPLMLHALSPNALDRPRLMLTHSAYAAR